MSSAVCFSQLKFVLSFSLIFQFIIIMYLFLEDNRTVIKNSDELWKICENYFDDFYRRKIQTLYYVIFSTGVVIAALIIIAVYFIMRTRNSYRRKIRSHDKKKDDKSYQGMQASDRSKAKQIPERTQTRKGKLKAKKSPDVEDEKKLQTLDLPADGTVVQPRVKNFKDTDDVNIRDSEAAFLPPDQGIVYKTKSDSGKKHSPTNMIRPQQGPKGQNLRGSKDDEILEIL